MKLFLLSSSFANSWNSSPWLAKAGRIAYHGVFWVALFAFLLYFDDSGLSTPDRWLNEFINLLFYALIVYFNLFYLIPNYLTKKRFLTYLLLLLAVTLILTPLRVIFLYFRFSGFPQLQNTLLGNLDLYFLLTFTIGGGSTILQIVTDWFKQLREKQELETQTMQSELRFLKSQINPHFLFNTLNNLYALTLKKSDKAPDIVIKLSEMMRYMLYECNEKRVPLYKEVNYLKNYLDLEQLRQHDNIRINFNVDGHVSDQQIAPLLFIPFLENSFKHGLNTQLKDGFVDIHLQVEQKSVDFKIENSKGQTIANPDNRPSGGIGLVNVRRRLNLLYPDHYQLRVSNTPNTFAVHLTIELE
ncbi:MAG: sensor histidine kinase [Lewinella sp.]|jgi:sensor histidine kinase YesM|uniref:sensor histidine kinase n=1 Tax=Lewinella sp. TaxID=2004506 RepID=UPI003D6A8263